jgi:hypothetical protein
VILRVLLPGRLVPLMIAIIQPLVERRTETLHAASESLLFAAEPPKFFHG